MGKGGSKKLSSTPDADEYYMDVDFEDDVQQDEDVVYMSKVMLVDAAMLDGKCHFDFTTKRDIHGRLACDRHYGSAFAYILGACVLLIAVEAYGACRLLRLPYIYIRSHRFAGSFSYLRDECECTES